MATAGWFADVGIRIFEGYGLTETSPVLALNNARDHRIGSVGKPIESVERRFADDGELLVRGPFVFAGYWQKPEATAQAIEATDGSIPAISGARTRMGFHVTDRKELIKTSGGKMIAPQPIESKLSASVLVANAALVGDRHNFPSALIAPGLSRAGKTGAGAGYPLFPLGARPGHESSRTSVEVPGSSTASMRVGPT